MSTLGYLLFLSIGALAAIGMVGTWALAMIFGSSEGDVSPERLAYLQGLGNGLSIALALASLVVLIVLLLRGKK